MDQIGRRGRVAVSPNAEEKGGERRSSRSAGDVLHCYPNRSISRHSDGRCQDASLRMLRCGEVCEPLDNATIAVAFERRCRRLCRHCSALQRIVAFPVAHPQPAVLHDRLSHGEQPHVAPAAISSLNHRGDIVGQQGRPIGSPIAMGSTPCCKPAEPATFPAGRATAESETFDEG